MTVLAASLSPDVIASIHAGKPGSAVVLLPSLPQISHSMVDQARSVL